MGKNVCVCIHRRICKCMLCDTIDNFEEKRIYFLYEADILHLKLSFTILSKQERRYMLKETQTQTKSNRQTQHQTIFLNSHSFKYNCSISNINEMLVRPRFTRCLFVSLTLDISISFRALENPLWML